MSFDCCENAVRIPALLLRADAQAPVRHLTRRCCCAPMPRRPKGT